MESNGEVGKVNCPQDTNELIKDPPEGRADDSEFIFESRVKLEAKGEEEVTMWFVDLNSRP